MQDAIQLFDSWSGLLSPQDFKTFAQPYLVQITEALSEITEVIIFAKGSWYALDDLAQTNASALGVDWCISPKMAREFTQNNITLQGSLDPHKLLLPIPELQKGSERNDRSVWGTEIYSQSWTRNYAAHTCGSCQSIC